MANIVENTGVYQGTEVRSWLVANAKLRVGMDRWSWEYVAYDIQDGHIGFYLNSDPAKRRHEVWGSDGEYLGVREALSSLHAQAEAMNRLRAALPELEGVEGIEVHTMDSLLSKLTGGQDWQDEKGAPEVDEVALMAEARAECAEFLGETDLSDALVDFLNARAPKMGDDALLRILARAVGHHMAERNMRETESLCWVMREAGDGYELTLKDGSEFSFLVRR